jgi:hypothetical protein
LFTRFSVESVLGLTTTHHQRRFTRPQRRLVHAMLDGVFECRNHFFNVRWQFDSPLDDRPDGDRRRQNDVRVQVNRLQIVVKIGPSTAMQRVAGLANTRAAILPMTRSADVRTLLVSKKYIGASIEALRVPLQTSRTLGQPCEVGIVSHDDEYVDVLDRPWLS